MCTLGKHLDILGVGLVYLARFQNYDEDTRLTDFSAPVTSKFNTPDTSTPSATPLSGNPDFLNPPGSSNNDIPF